MEDIFKDELVHDRECKDTICYRTMAIYNGILDDMKKISEDGYFYKNHKFIKGAELKKIINELNIKMELLDRILEPANKYRK